MPETSRSPNPVLFGGENFRTGLIAALTAGSIAIGGFIYTDRNQASDAELLYGTGAYLVYDDVVLTGSGGAASYTAGSIQCGTASCSIMRVEVQSEASPAGSKIDVGIVSALSSSGQTIMNNLTTSSGNTLQYAATGSLIPPNHYLKAVYTSSSPGNVTAQMRVWYNKFYTP